MPIQKPGPPINFIFEKSRAILPAVLIVASAALFLASNISTAEAARKNWACTHFVVFAYGFDNTAKLAVKAAWKDWRQRAKAHCGSKCAHTKNARNKITQVKPYKGRYFGRAWAKACYFLRDLETTQRPGGKLRAPTRLP